MDVIVLTLDEPELDTPEAARNGKPDEKPTASGIPATSDAHAEALTIPSGWYRHAYTYHVGHTKAMALYNRLYRWTGGLTVAVTTIAGTTLVTDLAAAGATKWSWVAAGLMLFAALLAALQAFAGFDKLETAHHKAAASYGNLQRELDEVVVGGGKVTATRLNELRKEYNDAETNGPVLPDRYWKYADNWVRLRMAGNIDPSGVTISR